MKKLILVCLLFAGCGGTNFSGTWKGTETGTVDGVPSSAAITVVLSQDGDSVTGNYAGGNGSGAITATADGDNLNQFVAMSTIGCNYPGSATRNGDMLTATVKANATSSCPALTATMTLQKE